MDTSATLAAIEDEEIVVGGAGAYVDMDELKISGVGTSLRGYYTMNEKSGSALSNEISSKKKPASFPLASWCVCACVW